MKKAKLTMILALAFTCCSLIAVQANAQQANSELADTQSESVTEFLFCQPDNNLMMAQTDKNSHYRQDRRMGQRKGPGPGHRGDQQKRRKHLEQLRMLKMLELLDLSEEQETPFLTAFRSVRRDIMKMSREKEGVLTELQEQLGSENQNDKKLTQLSEDILSFAGKKHAMNENFLAEAKLILNPNQFGKFVLFQERFEYELLERMKAFRSQQMQGTPANSDGR